MQFSLTTILKASRFGWRAIPSREERTRFFACAVAMGFEGIEWSPRWLDVRVAAEDVVRGYRDEFMSHGLACSGVNLNRFAVIGCPEAKDNRAVILRSVEVSRWLGAPSIIVSLSAPRPPTKKRPAIIGKTISREHFAESASFLSGVAERAEDVGVQLVLELHDDGLLDTPELCLKMVEQIDRTNVRVNPDLGNLVRQPSYGGDWRRDLALMAPLAGYWHVKNYQGGKPSPLWEGEIDYAEAMGIMRDHGYQGWVSIESYFADDVMELQRQSLEWLRTLDVPLRT